MTLRQRQEQLASQIKSVDNEDVLALLEQELSFFINSHSSDITDGLSSYQIDELISLAQEPSDKDTVTEEEYRKATGKWRTK